MRSDLPQAERGLSAGFKFSFSILSVPLESKSGRAPPQLQHSLNWPSTRVPHFLQVHGSDTGRSGARVRARTVRASANLASSSTQSSGQHSIGGSSPTAAERYKFLTAQETPPLSKIFLR